MKEPVTLVMSFWYFSVQSQTAYIECWFDGVTSDAKNATGAKPTVKGFESGNCLKGKQEFSTCSLSKLNTLLTHKTSSDSPWPLNYRDISPDLTVSTHLKTQNRNSVLIRSYSRRHQCRSRELLFQAEKNRSYQIGWEYSISLGESAEVKTSCAYSVAEDIAGNVQPVTKLNCFLTNPRRFISTNSRSNRNVKKLALEKASVSTIAAIPQFNSISSSAVVHPDVLTTDHKGLIGKRKERVIDRVIRWKETSS